MPELDAVVVGAGPNGLAAAITLAEAGASVVVLEAKDTPGGGMRTKELTLPGFNHDVCSAIHPMAPATPFFRRAGLDIEWMLPEVQVAHPFDDGTAAVVLRGVEETAAANDVPRWASLFRGVIADWDKIADGMLGPVLKVPKNPVTFLKFGLRSLPAASWFARALGERGGALFTGISAHANTNLSWPLSATGGVALIAAGHVAGWPAARGGSQSIADAMVTRLESLGGRVECGVEVRSMADVPPARAHLFDTTPWQLMQIAGEHRTPKAWKRFRRGGGSFKLDYALDGPMPWTAPEARRAGTVHLGGTWQEVAAAEASVKRGRTAEAPYVLVGQQSIFDPTRAPDGKHTLWAYCHVPNGCNEDMTPRIEAQLDRFAPGWRDLVLARVSTQPSQMQAYNANYVGGDIAGGAPDLLQVLFRPDMSLDPYRVGDENLWLCSSSTPPGGGVHGLCGMHAARSALATLR